MDVESRLRELGIAGRIKHRVIGDHRAFIVMPHELIYLTTDQVERVLLHDISKIASDKTGTLNIFSSAYMAISVNIRGFDPVALKTFFLEVKNAVAHAKAEESGVELPPVSGLHATRPMPTVTPSVTASGIHPAPVSLSTPPVAVHTPAQPPVPAHPDVMLGRPTITPAATPKVTSNNWGAESLDEPLDAIDDALEPADSGIQSPDRRCYCSRFWYLPISQRAPRLFWSTLSHSCHQ